MRYFKQNIYSLLRWSERYTKTDMIYFSKSIGWLNLSFIFVSIVGFGLSVIFAHFVSKDVYGTYQYILSISGIITAFTLTGMNPAVVRSVAQGNDGDLRYTTNIQFKWSILPFIISLGIGGYYFVMGNNTIALFALIIGAVIPITNATNTFLPYLNGKKDFKTTFIYNTILYGFYALSMTAIIFWKPTLFSLVLGYFISNMLVNVVLYFRVVRPIPLGAPRGTDTISYGKHLSVINFLGTISGRVDNILIFHYLGPIELAIYSFAKVFPDRLGGVFKSIGSIALPKFAEQKIASVRSTILAKTLQLIFIILLLIVVYMIAAPYLYMLFFPKYTDAISYSRIFSLSLITAAANIPIAALIAQKLKKQLYIFNIIHPLISMTLIFIGVYFYGIWGVILARVFSGILYLFLSVILILYEANTKI